MISSDLCIVVSHDVYTTHAKINGDTYTDSFLYRSGAYPPANIRLKIPYLKRQWISRLGSYMHQTHPVSNALAP